ncbi:uncharacterized protein [Miscanthus floridulus]|uniref:uncharacterized protein isoform X2 n=1 Tax=Miscanthus floridulus TaxID=154761 RepID=UPI003458E8C1
MAQSASMNEECANLLRRMDLEDSESDGESSKSEMAVDEKVISLGESVDNKEADHVEEIQEVGVLQDERVTQKKMMQSDGDLVTEQVKKRQKRKWGPILRIDRPKRVPKDGRTVMQKAQDFKEAGNTMKESSRSVRGLGKGVSGKPYPRLSNARRPRLEPGTFQSQAGVPWSGMKKVFAIVGRMLRSWLPMFKPVVQEKMEQVNQLVKVEASSAPWIKWSLDTSGSVQSTVQLLEGSGNASVLQRNRA